MLLCTFFAYNCPLLEFTDSRSARERCNARLLCSLSLSLLSRSASALVSVALLLPLHLVL
jgi:hypothetical protein